MELKYLRWKLDLWVRTSFFLVPTDTLSRLGSLATVADMKPYCPSVYTGQIFKDDAPFNEHYQLYVERWLAKGWYRAFELSESSWDCFRDETRLILNEQALTAKLRDLGVRIYGLRCLIEQSEATDSLLERPTRVLDRYRDYPL